MNRKDASRGFTLLETLISLTLTMIATVGLGSMLVQNARLNSSEQMKARVQSDARTCVSIIVQRIRSAGWDPQNTGVQTLVLDPEETDFDHSDGVDNLLIFADLNGDGVTDGNDEQILIRHATDVVELQPRPGANYITLVANVTNDADGDDTPEPMFIPDSATDPSRITVRVTARSPLPDPVTGEFLRYTVTTEVALRKSL